MQETQVWSLGWEDPLEKGMATIPVFLPGEFRGQGSLEGYSPWGCRVRHNWSINFQGDRKLAPPLGEGNGNPFQYSYLENPMDGVGYSVHGVAKSRTRLSNFTFTFTWYKEWYILPWREEMVEDHLWRLATYFVLWTQLFMTLPCAECLHSSLKPPKPQLKGQDDLVLLSKSGPGMDGAPQVQFLRYRDLWKTKYLSSKFLTYNDDTGWHNCNRHPCSKRDQVGEP